MKLVLGFFCSAKFLGLTELPKKVSVGVFNPSPGSRGKRKMKQANKWEFTE